ncbi:MAG: YmdB family metallophosphoesterase, partial [Acidobacteria bacterium]|nr:YmdB family metallophosphoesterase [Acidobacteriota bacterium]
MPVFPFPAPARVAPMRILFIGDVFGKAGRRLLKDRLSGLLAEQRIDFCVANVENAAGGFGLTPPIVEELLALGIDVLTSGNHVWDKKVILPYLDQQPRLLRPQNYPDGTPGTGIFIGESQCGLTVGVLNLQGRVYLPAIDCPFRTGDEALGRMRQHTPILIVDFHAEATSEKQAFSWYVDG